MAVKVSPRSSPFGSETRTRILLALQMLGESYPRELARLLEIPLSVVQKAIRTLEVDHLIAGRLVGRTRIYRLNPQFFAVAELERLLARLAEPDKELQKQLARLRKRPRRSGKALWR
jgi:DNA-binding transcriptional ArsR family regulator